MTLFKKRKNNSPALYVSLDKRLEEARRRNEKSFYYPLESKEISNAMAWGIRNRVAIEADYIMDDKIYYKFYGYAM